MEENKTREAETEPVKLIDKPESDEKRLEEKKEDSIEASVEASTEDKPKKKRDLYVELVLFLVLGFLIGVAIKTEAAKRITIGFDDNTMKIFSNSYDINKMQIDQAAKLAEEEKKLSEQTEGDASQPVLEEGGSCTAQ